MRVQFHLDAYLLRKYAEPETHVLYASAHSEYKYKLQIQIYKLQICM